MRRIIHLSDLHFGRTRPELLEPLLAVIRDLEPDLVALSGDLTQRARRSQRSSTGSICTGWPCREIMTCRSIMCRCA